MKHTMSHGELFAQQDRKRFPERQILEQKSLEDLVALATRKGIELPSDANRFVVVDLLMKKSEAEAREHQEAQRKVVRMQKEAQKKRDLEIAKKREKQSRSRETGLSKEATELLQNRIKSAQKTNVLDLSNTSDGTQNPFCFQQVPVLVLQTFRVRRDTPTGLKQLWLSNNEIKQLSPELRYLRSLEVLCLSGNQLTKLPGFIGGLRRLKRLYLTHNRIKVIPEQLQNLRNLEELYLDHNCLQTFSLTLTELRSLRKLSLCNNTIRQLPAEVRRLQDLVELHLDHNRIGPSLPRNLSRLRSCLKVLGVSYNCLTQMPSCLQDLDLAILRIEGNRSSDYVITDPVTQLIVPDSSIPRRLCDGLLQTKTGQASNPAIPRPVPKNYAPSTLPGYLADSEYFTENNARWFDDSELEAMHQLLRNRAMVTKQNRGIQKRKAALKRRW